MSRFLKVLALAVLAVTGAAQAVVIDFENLSPGGGGVFVTNQYAGLGVTFNSPRAFDYVARGFPTLAHSGTKAIEQCFATEFCTSPIRMDFTAGQSRVQIWVGCTFPLQSALTVFLRGYDANGNLVASDTVTLPVNTGVTLVRTPLTIGSFDSRIVRAEMTAGNGGFTGGIVVDDVEFDVVGPPPPCPASQPPTLNVLQTSSRVQTNRFLYRDQAASQDPAAMRTLDNTSRPGQPRPFLSSPVAQRPTMNTWLYGSLVPGPNAFQAAVADCAGRTTRSFTVQYDPIPDGTRFEVVAWEVTQAIQNVYQSMPLIAGKRTYMRVYLKTTGSGATVTGVTAVANAFAPGADPTWQQGAPREPYNLKSLNAITVDPTDSIDSRRGKMDGALLFELPPSWSQVGRLNFVLTSLLVDGEAVAIPVDRRAMDNDLGLLRFVQFDFAPAVQVRVIDVPYHKTGVPGTVYRPRDTDHKYLKSWLERAYPTADVFVSYGSTPVMPFAPDEVYQGVLKFNAGFVNGMLNEMREMDRATRAVSVSERYYGLVDDGGGFMRGKADSIPSTVASGPSGTPGGYKGDTDPSYADWYSAHELGHTFGRTHAEFCGAEACPEIISYFCPGGYQPYPYPGGKISGGNLPPFYGFDIGDASLNIKPAIYSPAVYTDIMTYCDNEWVSDFTYLRILNRMRAELGIESGGESQLPDGVILTGDINLTKNTASIRRGWRMDHLFASERPATSPFLLEYRDAGGAALASYPFLPKVDTELVAGEDVAATLAEVLPWVPGARAIALMRDGVTLATLPVSPSIPTVTVLSPNGGEVYSAAQSVTVVWQASDLDGGALTFAIQYSTDNGATWSTLASSITGTSHLIPPKTLPGSTTARMRVIASDGVNTGSDASNGAFRVAGHAPEASIRSPYDGAQYTTSQTVVFDGRANDLEDGPLGDGGITWTSSLQGLVGVGRSASARLNPGTHVLTLEATDWDGAVGATAVTVTVVAEPPVAVPGPGRVVLVGWPAPLNAGASEGVAPLQFRWELVVRPGASAAALTQADQPVASLTPDAPGDYIVQLTVTDSMGVSAVAQARLTAATAPNALRIAGGLQSATAGDVSQLNVETSGPSAVKVDIQDVVRLMKQASLVRQGAGVLTRGGSNRYGVSGVIIDHPLLNGWPSTAVMAQHVFVAALHPYPLTVVYDYGISRWVIQSDGSGRMTDGEKFAFAFGPAIRTVTRSAANAPFPWGVRLDDPLLRGNASAIPLAQHAFVAASNPSPLGVWYDGVDWVAYNEYGTGLANGEVLNYVDAAGSGGRVVHSSANTFAGLGVYIDDPAVNGQPNAVVLAQHRGGAQYNSAPLTVVYSTVAQRWVAFNDDASPMALGESVHYYVAPKS